MTKAEIDYYITHGTLPPIVKRLKQSTTVCKCGNMLSYTVSPFVTTERRVCPKCGNMAWVDYAPIDLRRAFGR